MFFIVSCFGFWGFFLYFVDSPIIPLTGRFGRLFFNDF